MLLSDLLVEYNTHIYTQSPPVSLQFGLRCTQISTVWMWKLREKAAQIPKLKFYIGRYAQNSPQSEIKYTPPVNKDWCKAISEQKKNRKKQKKRLSE